MKAMTLLEAIGDARPEYVQKAGSTGATLRMTEPVKPKMKKFKKTLLIVAALMTLILAGAAASNWFLTYYQARTPITKDQAQYIEAHTETQNQTITSNGYKIEMFTALADSNQIHIAFAITGPKNINLEEMGQELCMDIDVRDSNGNPGGYHQYGVEPDHDGLSNTQTYFYKVQTEGQTDWNVHIGKLYRRERDTAYEEELMATKYKGQTDVIFTDEETQRILKTTVLAEGPWDFDLNLSNQEMEEIQFVNEPVTIHAAVSRYDNESREQDVQLVSFKLYPSGAELKFDIQGVLTYESFDEVTVVMKDQSENVMSITDADANGLMHMAANGPILLDQVEKIVLPDGTVLQK